MKNLMRPPLKPNIQRYIEIFIKKNNLSIYRCLAYEELFGMDYAGRILDFGGGLKADYRHKLESIIESGSYESANIDPHIKPTYIIENGSQIPVNDEQFDMVVSINTLEHVYDLESTLYELNRVLKGEGRFVFVVPFLYRVHGCPDDFNRPTSSWWHKKLSEIGFNDLEITPLVWDPLTSGYSVSEGVPFFKSLRRLTVPLFGLIYSFVKCRTRQRRYPKEIADRLANFALGYVITGTKGSYRA